MNSEWMKWSSAVVMILSVLTLHGQTYTMSNSTVTTCSGSFFDSGGSAGNYGNSQNLVMTFQPGTPGQAISVSFTSFVTNPPFDYMIVYDGPNASSPQLAHYNGTNSPGTLTASTNNPSGALTFRFFSNGAGTASGWAATVSCGAFVAPNYTLANGNITACSGNLFDSGGATGPYMLNDNLTQTICPSTPGQAVSLNFSSIDIEAGYDFLYLYDGNSTAAPLLASFSSNTTGGSYTASSANPTGCLTLRFTEDGWDIRNGWSAAISCTTPAVTPTYAMQAGTYNQCDFIFTDDGGPNSVYMNNSTVTRTICPNSAAAPYVTAEFTQFNTEANFDILRVYDGNSTAAPLIGAYSGTIALPLRVSASSPSGCLTFQFTADWAVASTGWAALVQCTTIAALPVEWLNFEVTRGASNYGELTWCTAAETNNMEFVVERMNASGNFEIIGTVPGRGNSTQTTCYTFTDMTAGCDLTYYRLRQIDYNGNSTLSATRVMYECDEREAGIDFTILNQQLFLSGLKDYSGSVVVTMHNAMGQLLWETSANVNQLQNGLPLPILQNASVVIVSVQCGNDFVVKKIPFVR